MKADRYYKRFIMAGFLGLSLAIMLSALITWSQLWYQTKSALSESADNALYSVERYLAEAQTFLDRTLRLAPRDCSIKSREAFIPDLLSAVVVTDLLYTLPDKSICSLTYGDSISAFSWSQPVTHWKDMQFFILDEDVLAAGKGNLLAGRDGVFTLLPQQQMIRFYITGQPQQPQLSIRVNKVVLVRSSRSSVFPENHGWLVVSRTGEEGLTAEFSLPVQALRDYWLHTYWLSRWAVNMLILLLFCVCFYGYCRHQLSLKTAIRRALEQRDFSLYYQPIVDINTGNTVSLEALVRWQRAPGGNVSPEVFIPVTEQCGLICTLTRYVLEQAIRDLNELHKTHPDMTVAVNISAADLSSPGFAQTVYDLCMAYSLSPQHLKLEITERSLVDDVSARRNMDCLTEMGFVLVLDDFGTGYSSLSYLNKLPVGVLKIDRAFVAGLGSDTVTGSVVPQIVSMARQLDMDVIAEGVETQEQARALSALKIQYVQGWLYEKAMPFSAVQEKLLASDQQTPL
ncbi:EAL domain-containing protein [Citrobacter meridianamericanus]|uniref:EAL domain-containing protein n=1 Tax=Citrobacter meridianamericanus TaxID=2894201 RepID=A0ABT1BFZ5_9ENTR|nr:EAL domain-containing protein [Citrobacter meridianamericanus]MCO5784595.1 EAL domain-containing protein [Citrobacter meridianamericanus]